MKIDASSGVGLRLDRAREVAEVYESAGLDGLWTTESNHDPFLPLALAAEHTERLLLGTGVAIAFARNPMVLAQLSYDLNDLAGGRMVLGLGSQVRAHIERRFSSVWSHPTRRMREFVLALRAIWAAWQGEAPLNFRGEFYTHTLMTPVFDPGPSAVGNPRVFLAAVGPEMIRVAAEVADGLIVHPLNSRRYLEEHILAVITTGLGAAGRSRDGFEVSLKVMIGTGRDEHELAAATRAIRRRIAFYGSTPAYRPVFELHGRAGVCDKLRAGARSASWDEIADLIDDDLVDAFSVIGPPDEILGLVRGRYEGVVERVSLDPPYDIPPAVLAEIVASGRTVR